MKKFLSVLCVLLVFVSILISCGKTPEEGPETVIKADLTLEALYDILLEKGDGIRFSDIPEDYFYIISSTLVPQLRYPISEEISFYIMQISETAFSVILTVRSEQGEMDFTGAQEILDYIEGLSETVS